MQGYVFDILNALDGVLQNTVLRQTKNILRVPFADAKDLNLTIYRLLNQLKAKLERSEQITEGEHNEQLQRKNKKY